MFIATKIFRFAAAHKLSRTDAEKCTILHGHSYKVEVSVSAQCLNYNDMVLDFNTLKNCVDIEQYDHSCLNDFEENPTAEWLCGRMAAEIQQKLSSLCTENFVRLYKVKVWEEIDSCYAEYINEENNAAKRG